MARECHKAGKGGRGHTLRHLVAPKAMAATKAMTAPAVARAFFFSSSERSPFLAFSILHHAVRLSQKAQPQCMW